MEVKQSYLARFYSGEKVPRKVKKALIGTKCSKKDLKNRLKNIRVISEDRYGIMLNDYFCPKCGCNCEKRESHYVEYPEIWNDYYCLRCGYHTAYEDNGPYTHCLESTEDNYSLD